MKLFNSQGGTGDDFPVLENKDFKRVLGHENENDVGESMIVAGMFDTLKVSTIISNLQPWFTSLSL